MPEADSTGNEVFLGLGSNLPYREKDCRVILEEACAELEQTLRRLRRSSFYRTEPVGVKDQNFFINCAVTGFFDGNPYRLLEIIQQIEASYGRNRANERRWGERTLDIDILLFGNMVLYEEPLLIIPHAELNKRRFALEPLCEISPEKTDPQSGQSYSSICEALPDQGVIRL